MDDPFRLDGKIALVTGANRGIGLGIALAFARRGADVALIARDKAALASAAAEIESTGRKAWTFSFDLSKTADIESFFNEAEAESGPIDILVNSAGITHRERADELDLADWQRVIDVNLTAVFALCKAFGRRCIDAGRPGNIINIGSLMCDVARETNAPYAASKGGIKMLTKALALDWAPFGIRVNAIGPGYIDTDLTQKLKNDEEFNSWVLERTPLGRWGKPDDIAGAAVFLASQAADFITGQLFYVDGGWLATF